MLYERYLELCKERKEAPSTVATKLGYSKNAFTRWKETASENNGIVSLRSEMLLKIAEYFDVSIDYLCGRSDERNKSVLRDTLLNNPRKMILLDEADGMSDKSLEQVIRMMRLIKGMQEE